MYLLHVNTCISGLGHVNLSFKNLRVTTISFKSRNSKQQIYSYSALYPPCITEPARMYKTLKLRGPFYSSSGHVIGIGICHSLVNQTIILPGIYCDRQLEIVVASEIVVSGLL